MCRTNKTGFLDLQIFLKFQVIRDPPTNNMKFHCGVYIPLSDDKHQMVRDSSKKHTGQRGRNSNPVATLPHATVVFHMQPFNIGWVKRTCSVPY